MPFKSEAQRAWMYANHPEMAERWEAHTPKGKKLPKRKGKPTRNGSARLVRVYGAGRVSHVLVPAGFAGGVVRNASVRIGPLADTIHDQMDDVTRGDARETARIIRDATERGVTDYERVGREIARRTDYGGEDRDRARTVARTELTRAYAEGFLADLDDDATVVFVAGDEGDTCQECLDLDGEEFTVAEAQGVLPLHTNCTCTWELADGGDGDDDLADNANPEGCNQYTGPGCGAPDPPPTFRGGVAGGGPTDPEWVRKKLGYGEPPLLTDIDPPYTPGRLTPDVVRSAPVLDVPPHEVVSTQSGVSAAYVRALAGGAVPRDPGLPLLVRAGGRLYADDGTHRVSAAVLRGDRTVRARVVDYDRLPPARTDNYSPDQPRDEAGHWTDGMGAEAKEMAKAAAYNAGTGRKWGNALSEKKQYRLATRIVARANEADRYGKHEAAGQLISAVPKAAPLARTFHEVGETAGHDVLRHDHPTLGGFPKDAGKPVRVTRPGLEFHHASKGADFREVISRAKVEG